MNRQAQPPSRMTVLTVTEGSKRTDLSNTMAKLTKWTNSTPHPRTAGCTPPSRARGRPPESLGPNPQRKSNMPLQDEVTSDLGGRRTGGISKCLETEQLPPKQRTCK